MLGSNKQVRKQNKMKSTFGGGGENYARIHRQQI